MMSKKVKTPKPTKAQQNKAAFYSLAAEVQDEVEAKDWKMKHKALKKGRGSALISLAQEDEDKVYQARLTRAEREGQIQMVAAGVYERQRLGLLNTPDLQMQQQQAPAGNFNSGMFDSSIYTWTDKYAQYKK